MDTVAGRGWWPGGGGVQTVCTLSDLSKNKMETPPKSPPTNHQPRNTYPLYSFTGPNLLCYPIMYSRNVTVFLFFVCFNTGKKNLLIPNTLFVGHFVLSLFVNYL